MSKESALQVKDSKQTGPLAGAGPYDYDLPVAHGGGQPAHMSRPVPKDAGSSWWFGLIFVLLNVIARWLNDWSGLKMFQCYLLIYGTASILGYWWKPKPRPDFLPWTLKMVGIWLNCYVGLATVPESLRGLLPAPLAFGLPAFLITAFLYYVLPVNQVTGKKLPLWQWLLFATAAAVIWGLFGPSVVK